ncbi:MAG: histidine--tRNA ligase [Candidatus Omnitrophota bacterium]
MEDLIPGAVEKWQWLERKARTFFESRGYKEIRTPILEYTDLFVRSVGESSDIVHKEMFSFEDRGGRHVTMRPEMTASVARSVIEKGLLTQAKSLRFYYVGPMFRAERPQAGRKRQFHQIGIELLNESGPEADMEAVAAICDFMTFIGVKGLRLRVNDLGSESDQTKTAEGLRNYFGQSKDRLCQDCQWRLEKNVLRIFDCKNGSCQPVIDAAPWDEIAPLGGEFQTVAEAMTRRGIRYEISRRLVRGLDYYNGLVFEAASDALGAQDAVAGGGRYDRLYRDLGGAQVPCIGFSIGMERLLSVLEKQEGEGFWEREIREKTVYLALLDPQDSAVALRNRAGLDLCNRNFKVEMLARETSLSKHLKKANQLGLRFVVMIGPDEVNKNKLTVKDMTAKTQTEVEAGKIADYLEGVTLR